MSRMFQTAPGPLELPDQSHPMEKCAHPAITSRTCERLTERDAGSADRSAKGYSVAAAPRTFRNGGGRGGPILCPVPERRGS